MTSLLAIGLAYLLGSVSGSLLLGRWRGVDIRTLGSGNAGGTNAFRTQGWRFALGVVLVDFGKGALAVGLARTLAAPEHSAWLHWAALLAAVIGHVWPVFHGFRGGKGAATLLGGLAVAWPLALLPMLAVWLLVLTLSGYVGLATVLAGAVLVPMAWLAGPDAMTLPFAGVASALLAVTHRANLQRLHAGTENRFQRARIWARLWSRWRAL